MSFSIHIDHLSSQAAMVTTFFSFVNSRCKYLNHTIIDGFVKVYTSKTSATEEQVEQDLDVGMPGSS